MAEGLVEATIFLGISAAKWLGGTYSVRSIRNDRRIQF